MAVYDCCPVMYAPLVARPPSYSQSVVLLLDAIVTTNKHVAPLLPRRSGDCHSMHRVVHACVAWLYHLSVASGQAGMLSVSFSPDISQAVNMAWVGLQWALEHEALEAFSVVLAAYMSTAPRLGKGPTSVAEKLGRTCVHGDL